MARPKKGKLLPGLRGRPVRITERLEKPYYPLPSKPRGRAAGTWEFTTLLKERAPLVYVYVVDQLRLGTKERETRFQKIVDKWRQRTGRMGRPLSKELTAYTIERAFEGAWEKWAITLPCRTDEVDSFYRRYVHGHPSAIKVFRKCLHEPKPWPRHHVGRELKWFLGKSGDAARHYGVLARTPTPIPILTIREE